jgi:hypothetical protein
MSQSTPVPTERPIQSPSATTDLGAWPSASTELPLLISPPQLALILGRSTKSLERDRAAGRGPAFRKIGRTIFYTREAVLSFLNAAA